MPAGKRRQRLTFQQRAPDENGARLGDWEKPGLKRWGQVVVRTHGEVVLQQRLQGVQPAEITVLSDPGTREVTTAWRMVWNGTPYNVKTVAPDERGYQIVFLAQADQTDA